MLGGYLWQAQQRRAAPDGAALAHDTHHEVAEGLVEPLDVGQHPHGRACGLLSCAQNPGAERWRARQVAWTCSVIG
jgi:hypothetical protein